jgi:hypothetical protein
VISPPLTSQIFLIVFIAAFEAWAPKLFNYYKTNLRKLFDNDPTLMRPFNSIFTAASFNLGPQTVSFPHIDFGNLPFGLCAITALGSFDPVRGGHLVLWECRLVIQFPPGSTILIPSAVIKHSNIKIREGERRYSFAQYCAGGLFRWVDYGFKTVKDFESSCDKDQLLEVYEVNKGRWKFGLELFNRIPFVRKC